MSDNTEKRNRADLEPISVGFESNMVERIEKVFEENKAILSSLYSLRLQGRDKNAFCLSNFSLTFVHSWFR
jgi:hypothetical protein